MSPGLHATQIPSLTMNPPSEESEGHAMHLVSLLAVHNSLGALTQCFSAGVNGHAAIDVQDEHFSHKTDPSLEAKVPCGHVSHRIMVSSPPSLNAKRLAFLYVPTGHGEHPASWVSSPGKD